MLASSANAPPMTMVTRADAVLDVAPPPLRSRVFTASPSSVVGPTRGRGRSEVSVTLPASAPVANDSVGPPPPSGIGDSGHRRAAPCCDVREPRRQRVGDASRERAVPSGWRRARCSRSGRRSRGVDAPPSSRRTAPPPTRVDRQVEAHRPAFVSATTRRRRTTPTGRGCAPAAATRAARATGSGTATAARRQSR